MDWLYYILLFVALLAGLFINLLGMPGLWIMVAGYAIYAWLTWSSGLVGWPSLVIVLVLAIVAEVVEFLAGAAGSKAAGGRRRGMAGAVIGGVVGAILGTFIPLIIIGTIIGACVGSFLGAAIVEFWDKDLKHSVRVGVGAAKGRFYGIVYKSLFGIAMLIVAMIAGIPFGSGSSPAATPAAAATPAVVAPSLPPPPSTLPASGVEVETTTQPAATVPS